MLVVFGNIMNATSLLEYNVPIVYENTMKSAGLWKYNVTTLWEYSVC